MKQKTHRLLSLLLCLVMVLGLLPATPAMASEPGRTEDNPVVCKTFDEFKAAMQGSAAFVKLAGGYFEATVTGSSIQNAVYTNGNKTLIVEGYNKFVPAEGDQSQINSLIAVGLNNNLTIQGTGQIEYWHENFLEAGAVICLEATGASLTVNGEVTIKGYHDGSNVHGRAIYATTGTVTINGGKFVGDDARNEGYTAESSVVTIKGDASLKVNGGTFMTGGSTQCDHGVYINTTGDVQLRAGTFQNNGITIDKNVTIADSGCFTGATIKTGIGYGETSVLSDWNQNVSVLKGKTVVLEYPYFIRDISATVTKPADGASPVFSATAGDDSYTVTVYKWFDGGTAESPNTLGVMNASDTFVAGNPYVVAVTFTPKEGYVILPGYSAAINGVDAVLTGSNTGTGAVSYRVAFTATAKKYSGTGSYNDPAVCTNFEAFKQAMENPSIQYVKLVGNKDSYGAYKVDTIPVTEDGVSMDAVLCDGRNKVLILEGNTKFEGPATSKSLIRLSVNNRLTITGDGTLAYWHSNFHKESAVVHLNGTGAQLTVEDGVRLRGFAEAGDTHGRAIYAKTGTVIINGGILYGEDALTTVADKIFTSAVTITGNANLTVNGGYISTTREEDKQCESALYLNTTGQVNLREGEILEAGIVVVPNTLTINGSAYFVGSRVYTKSGSEWVEQSDRTQPVSILEGTNVKMSFTQFIDAATVTVTDPMSGQAPNTTSFTVGGSTYTVDQITWYNGGTVDNPGTKMTSSDTFEAGQTYIVDVRVKPTSGSGYVIRNGCTVTINGVPTDKAFYRDGITGAGNYRVALTAQPNVLTGRVQFTSAANPGKPIGMVLVDGTVKDVNSTALNYQWQIKVDDTWRNVGTDRNYSPAAADLGRQIRVIVTADGYEGSIVSDALTIAKAFNPASPSKAPDLEARQAGPSYTTLRVYTKAGQDYVWRDSQEADPKAIDWSVNAFTKPADANYVDITGLTEGTTYYVYTRISETESTQAGVGVKYSSLLLKTPDFLQKVVLEGYTDYGDGNTIYIPVGQTVTINVEKYPADASTWNYFTFGDPSLSTYIYEVTDPTGQVQETMPTRIMLKGNNVGTGTLKAYYNGGMYDYGSWRVIVYDTLQAGQVTFTDKPAYDDISLYVGDSYTPTAPASGLLLPTEANDGRFEYRWYLYEGTDSISGSPYGTTTNNGYLSIDPETGKVTALSANRTGTHQPYVKLCLVDKEDTSKYQVVTEYKVTVASNGEIPVDGVTVVPTTTTMAPGTSMMPTAVVSPSNHTETGSVVWSKVSGSDSITIDPVTGKVTVSGSAVDGDTATIRATFGDKYGECVITVSTIKYGVTVTNGIAYVGAGTVITETMEGTKVSLKANDAPAGKVFDKWVVTTGDVIFANAANAETYFVMPGEAVAVEATYKDKIVLTDLSATVDAPVAGAMPDLTATVGGYGYTAKVEWWIKEGEVWTQVDDKPFVAGQEYSIYIEFYADYGYAFASEEALTATLNGKEATYEGYGGDHLVDYSIWVTVLTPVPENAATCTVAGNKAYYINEKTGDWFWDAEGVLPITDHDSVVIPATSHTASGDWQKSSTDHWKVCGCGTILDKAAHDYGDDNVCDTCGYTKTSGGNPTDPSNPTVPSDPTDPGQKPDSPDTGDNSNLFLWAALLFVSGCGIFGATIYGKKKKENAE